MDEVESPQTPVDLFFILKMLADKGVPAQTIAPKFTGRFNKGVDYTGDVAQFAKEFEEDVLVIDFAIKEFGLPEELKLSVHSGSDKFSIYPVMADVIKKYNKGIHVKTAGTTWLEEVIGLALAGGKALMPPNLFIQKLLAARKNCALLMPMLLILRQPAFDQRRSGFVEQREICQYASPHPGASRL